MAIGDLSDVLSRLKATLPARWFASTTPGLNSNTPVLDGVLSGAASTGSWLYSLLEYVAQQRRVATATDVNLDIISQDFFGLSLPRIGGEADSAFRVRIIANLLAAKNTRASIIAALRSLTGNAPVIFEPRNTSDTGGYGHQGMTAGTGLGYGLAGGYGSLLLPFQAFVTAYRPHGGGVSNSEGYYGLGSGVPAIGGYGVGSIQYASMSMLSGVITDDEILATIAATAPISTIMWSRVTNYNGAAQPLQPDLARLVLKQVDQVVRAGIFSGATTAALTETQAAQSIIAAVNGATSGSITETQASQTIIAATLAASGWNPLDASTLIAISNNNLTASTASSGAAGVRSNTGHSANAWYGELALTTVLSGERFGVANASWSETTALGSDANSVGVDTSGSIWINGATVGKLIGTPAAGSILRIALDVGLNKVWFALDNNAWAPTAASVTGTRTAGTSGSGPVITAPVSGTVTSASTLSVSGCSVADTIWPRTGNCTLNVSCSSGTLSMSLSGSPVSGSGTSQIQMNDTSANIQTALGTLSFTAGSSNDAITLSVVDQASQSASLTIPVSVLPPADPTIPSGSAPTILSLTAESGTRLTTDPVASPSQITTEGGTIGPYGGFAYSITGSLMLAFSTTASGSSVTANFGGTAFSYTVPTGYNSWNAVAAPPTAPSSVTPSAETTSSITLSWSPSS